MRLMQRRGCLTLALLPENKVSLSMQVMNINLRPKKCSGQSRYGRYGSYATAISPAQIMRSKYCLFSTKKN